MDNQELQNFIEKDTSSLADSMRRINEMSKRILFLINDKNRLVGTLTDGDIRRYLLSGGKIEDSSFDAANKSPIVAHSFDDAIKLHQEKYVAIPVVDENWCIEDIYVGNGKERHFAKIGIPVVINAGGKGTRLDPFTRVLPKPLIPVGELPIIELIMKEYQKYSCSEFHIIVNYKKELMKAYFKDLERSYNITWYDEEKPLGTGGGLSLLRGKFKDTFFFVNCDALLTANYESIFRFHKDNSNVITTICAYKNMNIPYGIVEMGENGIIKGMKEKPCMSFLTNTGIYLVEPEVIDGIRDGENIGFPDIIERERENGKKVAVFPVNESDWMDMGQLPELEKMRVKLYGK